MVFLYFKVKLNLRGNDFESLYRNIYNKSSSRLGGKVLVLNQNYEAISICTVQRAVILIYLGKAELITSRDSIILRSISMSFPFPSIVRLKIYVHVPYKKIVLTRKNILRRDLYKCQYCGRSDVTLTIDHIIPKSKGGDDSWENLVAACISCNNKKGDRSPEEAKMTLHKKPSKPSHITFMKNFAGRLYEDWKPFLYMS